MTLDTSALIAVLFAESGHLDLVDRMLGDCLASAAAVEAGDSLLFVGDDFAATDVRVA